MRSSQEEFAASLTSIFFCRYLALISAEFSVPLQLCLILSFYCSKQSFFGARDGT